MCYLLIKQETNQETTLILVYGRDSQLPVDVALSTQLYTDSKNY